MPLSKRRKRKNGKVVGSGERKNREAHDTRIEQLANAESGVTLQELINVLAYQEAHPEEAAGMKGVEPHIHVVDEATEMNDNEENQDGR